MNKQGLWILFAVVGAVIVSLEMLVKQQSDATILFTLTYWAGIAQGCVALVAVVEIAKGVWLNPVKRHLLSAYPMLLFVALLYPLVGTQMDIYAWSENPNAWLNVRFFLARNFVLLLATFWVGRMLSHAVMRGEGRRFRFAVFYVLLWVTTQSFVAFDWIMSLEYPWISTLFGWYLMIESLVMGLTMSAIIIFFRTRAGAAGLKNTLWDTGKMLFAFCFLWAGFFFTQYLVIWYGNLPEEVGYVLKRVDPSPYWGLSRVVLTMIFIIPFVTLLSRPLKMKPPFMLFISLVVLAGLFIEKIVLITPAAPVSPVFLAIEMILMVPLIALLIKNRDSFMPQQVTEPEGDRGHHG